MDLPKANENLHAINSLAVCISDPDVLQQLKEKKEEKQVIEQDKIRKRKKRELEKEAKQRERLEKKRECLEKIKKKHDKPTKKSTRSRSKVLGKAMEELGLSDSDDNCECPKCKLHLDGYAVILVMFGFTPNVPQWPQMIFLTFFTVKAAFNWCQEGP